MRKRRRKITAVELPKTAEETPLDNLTESTMVCEETQEGLSEAPKELRECAKCRVLLNDKRQLRNQVRNLREKLKKKRNEVTQFSKELEGRPSSWTDHFYAYSCKAYCNVSLPSVFVSAIMNFAARAKFGGKYCV